MYVLKTISFCGLFILTKNIVNCADGGGNGLPKPHILWEPDNLLHGYIITNEITRNLRDVVPKNVSTWGRFSLSIRGSNNNHVVYSVLKENSITDINNLTRIILKSIGISDIERGALKNLPQLVELQLSYNKLTEIKFDTFANLTISELDLEFNNISVLQPGAFEHLPNLKVLLLGRNNLRTLPNGVVNNLPKLQHLALSENHLSKIESEAFLNLPHLTKLDLDFNELTELSCSILNLPQLNSLDLRNNLISKLDSGCFKNLPQLGVVNLRGNRLHEIPEGFLNGSKLEELDLNTNNISVIAFNAFDSPSLRILNIFNNKLTVWESRWLHSTPQLQKLLADSNEIEELPDGAFSYCSHIVVSFNHIKSISRDAFRNLKVIDHLDLSYNKIELWDESLLNNITVDDVDLSNNQLQCVDGHLEKAFGSAQRVNLAGNPWRPDCQTKIDEFQEKH